MCPNHPPERRFTVSPKGKDVLRKYIRNTLESDAASGVPLDGTVWMLAHWVTGLLENRDDERLSSELTEDRNTWREKRRKALDALEEDAKERWIQENPDKCLPPGASSPADAILLSDAAKNPWVDEATEDETIWLPK